MNNLSAIVNVGRDAEVKFTANGDPITSFSVALTSGFGEKSVVSWLNASIFGKRGQTLAPMLLKGTRIGITGELTNRPYQDKSGNEKHSLEVRLSDVTLLGKKDSESVSVQHKTARPNEQDFDESIPF